MQEAQHEKSHGVSAESWSSHPLVCGFRRKTATGEAGFKEQIKSCGTMSPFKEQL